MSRKQIAIILGLGLIIVLLVVVIIIGVLLGWNFRKSATPHEMVTRECLTIQWTYDKASVGGYTQKLGADNTVLVRYDRSGGAGHAILLQHSV